MYKDDAKMFHVKHFCFVKEVKYGHGVDKRTA